MENPLQEHKMGPSDQSAHWPGSLLQKIWLKTWQLKTCTLEVKAKWMGIWSSNSGALWAYLGCILGVYCLILAPCNCRLWEETGDDLTGWIHATHEEDLEWVLGFCLQPGLVLCILSIWEANYQIGSLCLLEYKKKYAKFSVNVTVLLLAH